MMKMIFMMMMRLLSRTKVIKNARQEVTDRERVNAQCLVSIKMVGLEYVRDEKNRQKKCGSSCFKISDMLRLKRY